MSEPVYALPAVDLEKWSHCRTLGPQKRDALIAEIRRLRTEVAALTSSPSEPLVEVSADVRELAARVTGNFERRPMTVEEASALITARDAQVAARVREEMAELERACGVFVGFLQFAEAKQELGELDQPLDDRTVVAHLMAGGGSILLDISHFRRLRTALTATGGGE